VAERETLLLSVFARGRDVVVFVRPESCLDDTRELARFIGVGALHLIGDGQVKWLRRFAEFVVGDACEADCQCCTDFGRSAKHSLAKLTEPLFVWDSAKGAYLATTDNACAECDPDQCSHGYTSDTCTACAWERDQAELAAFRAAAADSSSVADELRAMLARMVEAHDGSHSEACDAFGHGGDQEQMDQNDGDDDADYCDCGGIALRNESRALLSDATCPLCDTTFPAKEDHRCASVVAELRAEVERLTAELAALAVSAQENPK